MGRRVAVMGTGTWGTTFALVLADAGCEVVLWGRRAQVCEEIRDRHRNPEYLPEVALPGGVSAGTDPAEALAGAEMVVLALPAQTLRENLGRWRRLVPADAVLVSLMKGIELASTRRVSQVVTEVAGIPVGQVAVVSGPNLALEIAARQPTATVVACTDGAVAEKVAQACSTPYFRPYTNTDVVGTELGGAVKNVIALAVGMTEGMGLGDNSKASIITRGLAETIRLAVASGGDPATLAGLAGLGDLVATCVSPLSRNHTVGVELGRGATMQEVLGRARRTAEGLQSCQSVLDLAAAAGVDMPITEAVVAVVRDGLPVPEMARRLLSRPRGPEAG